VLRRREAQEVRRLFPQLGPIGVAETTSLTAIDVYNESSRKCQMVAISSNGNIYQRTRKQRWNQIPSPTKNGLDAIRLGDEYDVAVGKAGTVIERPRGKS
jgi:hypothetical protein